VEHLDCAMLNRAKCFAEGAQILRSRCPANRLTHERTRNYSPKCLVRRAELKLDA
jgi:hypothetical protein